MGTWSRLTIYSKSQSEHALELWKARHATARWLVKQTTSLFARNEDVVRQTLGDVIGRHDQR